MSDRIAEILTQGRALLDELQALLYPPPPPPPDLPPPPDPHLKPIKAGDDLQAALDAALPGDILHVEAGATFTGNYALKVSGTSDQPITLTTAGALPDRRVTAEDGAAFFSISAADPLKPALDVAGPVAHWRIVGLEIRPNTKAPDRPYVTLGRLDATTLDQLPRDIRFDRCWVHADPAIGGKRGIQVAASDVAITRSRIVDFWYSGADAQAIWIFAGTNMLIEDNQLEGSGENILTGGADTKAAELMPTNLTIRRNTLYKPDYYRTHKGSVKNALELKVGINVTIELNDIGPSWVDGQAGNIVGLTPRNSNGGAPWTTISNVVFRHNRVHDGPLGLNVLGQTDLASRPTGVFDGLEVSHNLFVRVGTAIQMGWGGQHFSILHNTFTGVKYALLKLYGGIDQPSKVFTNFVYRDNLTPGGDYGITGDGAPSIGEPALAYYAPGYLWACNVVEKDDTRSIKYPAGTTLLPFGAFAQQVDLDTGAIVAGSTVAGVIATDGGTVGADLAALAAGLPQ